MLDPARRGVVSPVAGVDMVACWREVREASSGAWLRLTGAEPLHSTPLGRGPVVPVPRPRSGHPWACVWVAPPQSVGACVVADLVALRVPVASGSAGSVANGVDRRRSGGAGAVGDVQASAIAFQNKADDDIRYAVLEASSVSEVLLLDTVVLSYFSRLVVLRWSRFFRECASWLCRMEPLVVGIAAVQYYGLSKTALVIIFALCSRMVCRIYGEERLNTWTRSVLEGVG
uniref:Uncharacterized protein n=1 Tax=Arundo donax TaxID=35708 RepID=A0A0A9DDH0_ARUDO